MSQILKDKVAIVTGSGQGVGRAVALGFAKLGAKVVTNNRKPGSTGSAMLTDAQFAALSDERKEWYKKAVAENEGDAATTAQAIRLAGGEAVHCFADISKFEDAERLVKTAIDAYGRIDIVVNVAGAFGFSNIDEISEELWDKVTSIKPKGYFNVIRFAVPYMKKQGGGRIINCTSRAYQGDIIKHAEYCAANAGVVGLTRAAAIELWPFGITCNAFSPFAKTRAAYEMDAVCAVTEEPILATGRNIPPSYETTPLPDAIVPFLAYLASDQASEVSGSVFELAGNKIQLHAEPVICRTMQKFGSEYWTVEEIAAEAKKSLFNDYRSIAKLS